MPRQADVTGGVFLPGSLRQCSDPRCGLYSKFAGILQGELRQRVSCVRMLILGACEGTMRSRLAHDPWHHEPAKPHRRRFLAHCRDLRGRVVAFHRGSWGGRRQEHGHVGARTEETWYARQCRDGSVLSCPSLIVHPLPAGMALLQPRADRACFWGRDAGGGSPLSPVSGDGPERPAPAISGAVCRGFWSCTNWGMILLRPQLVCAGRLAPAAVGGDAHAGPSACVTGRARAVHHRA
jgi:hypothetical protein